MLHAVLVGNAYIASSQLTYKPSKEERYNTCTCVIDWVSDCRLLRTKQMLALNGKECGWLSVGYRFLHIPTVHLPCKLHIFKHRLHTCMHVINSDTETRRLVL